MKTIAKYLIKILLYLPCTKTTSILVDKLVVYIEGGGTNDA